MPEFVVLEERTSFRKRVEYFTASAHNHTCTNIRI